MRSSKDLVLFPLNRDQILFYCLKSIASISVVSVLFILFYLIAESTDILQQVSLNHYFFDDNWHPNNGEFLLLPMIVGVY